MKAASRFGEDVYLKDVVVPPLEWDAIRLRVEARGVCGTDPHWNIDTGATSLSAFKYGCAPDRIIVATPPSTLPETFEVAAKGGIVTFIGLGEGHQVAGDQVRRQSHQGLPRIDRGSRRGRRLVLIFSTHHKEICRPPSPPARPWCARRPWQPVPPTAWRSCESACEAADDFAQRTRRGCNSAHMLLLLLASAFAVSLSPAKGNIDMTDESAKMISPLPCQVVQRDPATVRKGSAGSGSVLLRWTDNAPVAACEWRVVALQDAFGKGTAWAPVRPPVSGDVCAVSVTIPAGGWYRLEVRRPGAAAAVASVEPVGVGEVFLIAGQSYAANCNDERLKVEEPRKRVTCLDPKSGAWRVADDPQPGASEYKGGGTIWPAFGDGLVKQLKVPVGFANVAWQGTASSQWMPGQGLHKALLGAAKKLGRFRAVLWQQGESDVMGGVQADTYVSNITAIRHALAKEVGHDLVWMPAKSALHPTVYNNPKGESVIRGAVDRLWKTKGFFPGPDTDALTGDNRGGPSSCQHFSGKGQRNAAAMWVNAVEKLIEETGKR